MQLLVFEDAAFQSHLPLVYSRCTFNLRCGFDNLLSKIEKATKLTADALFVRPALAAVIAERQPRRVNQPATGDDQLWVNGRFLMRSAIDIPMGAAVWMGDALVAGRFDRTISSRLTPAVLLDPAKLRELLAACPTQQLPPESGILINHPWQLIKENAAEITRQCGLTPMDLAGRIADGAHLVNGSAIHVGAGSNINPGSVLDAESGPIYIGENVTVHAGAVIQGPCYIGDGCTIQPGAAIRGGCSIGMVCKIGGEVEGTIFHGYSNKQHDGFIGHSYIGEWVNLGADTVGSDLKNTYGPVRVPINGTAIDTGEMFVGAFIGDHTKTAIRTTLPTGCVIGYACNVALSGFVPNFVPSFSWLTDKGRQTNDPQKALAVARTVVGRRNRTYSKAEESLFLAIQQCASEIENTP
ncbi:hypothetical protein B7486_01300 [cyanobacterium TDX16]|nr:hypothetical protein B7486_01300 [cyanobacterium TDX16]